MNNVSIHSNQSGVDLTLLIPFKHISFACDFVIQRQHFRQPLRKKVDAVGEQPEEEGKKRDRQHRFLVRRVAPSCGNSSAANLQPRFRDHLTAAHLAVRSIPSGSDPSLGARAMHELYAALAKAQQTDQLLSCFLLRKKTKSTN